MHNYRYVLEERFQVKYISLISVTYTMGEYLPDETLKVKKAGILEGIPGFLQRKHFWTHDSRMDQYTAMQVSKNRIQTSAGKYIFSNTVFEADCSDSEVLLKCIVIGGPNDLIGKTIVISKKKLKKYKSDFEYDNWEPGRCKGFCYAIFEDETSNFHLRSDFRNFNKIDFNGEIEECRLM